MMSEQVDTGLQVSASHLSTGKLVQLAAASHRLQVAAASQVCESREGLPNMKQ